MTPPTMRPSEARVAGEEDDYDEDGTNNYNNDNNDNNDKRNQLLDPLIFPGLYSPSGFNIMSILVSLANLSRYHPNARSTVP